MLRRLRLVPALLLLAAGWVTPAMAAPAPVAPAPAPAALPADPAFAGVWARTDQLVLAHDVTRTWFWGQAAFARLQEPFGANGTTRLVEYYDKSRMEINNPAGDRSSPWFVTNGLLVKELMTGQMVAGVDQTVARKPSVQAVVGDFVAGNPAPTYAILGRFASVAGPVNHAPNRVGMHVTATLDKDGRLGTSAALGALAGTRLGTYVEVAAHNIPDIFWNFLTARGPLLTGPVLTNGPLENWVYALGYPVTEPYWVRARIGGHDRDVLVQAFERRILTYTPSNPAGWQVEMGNVGQHYYAWRYGDQHPGQVAPPPVAVRIVSAAAHLDSRIIPTYVQNNAWQVADYAVGWLYGTPQPGQPGNSVFSGHNNYHGEVFRYLELLQMGDTFTIYTSDGRAHRYRVNEMDKVPEKFVSLDQQIANAHYMDNTPDERVTLITCWPYVTYTHRLIIIGKPIP